MKKLSEKSDSFFIGKAGVCLKILDCLASYRRGVFFFSHYWLKIKVKWQTLREIGRLRR